MFKPLMVCEMRDHYDCGCMHTRVHRCNEWCKPGVRPDYEVYNMNNMAITPCMRFINNTNIGVTKIYECVEIDTKGDFSNGNE